MCDVGSTLRFTSTPLFEMLCACILCSRFTRHRWGRGQYVDNIVTGQSQFYLTINIIHIVFTSNLNCWLLIHKIIDILKVYSGWSHAVMVWFSVQSNEERNDCKRSKHVRYKQQQHPNQYKCHDKVFWRNMEMLVHALNIIYTHVYMWCFSSCISQLAFVTLSTTNACPHHDYIYIYTLLFFCVYIHQVTHVYMQKTFCLSDLFINIPDITTENKQTNNVL